MWCIFNCAREQERKSITDTVHKKYFSMIRCQDQIVGRIIIFRKERYRKVKIDAKSVRENVNAVT